MVGGALLAEEDAGRIGEEVGVYDGEVFFGDGFWVVAVLGAEAFF